MPDFGESIVIDAPGDQLYTSFVGHNRAGAIRWFTQSARQTQ